MVGPFTTWQIQVKNKLANPCVNQYYVILNMYYMATILHTVPHADYTSRVNVQSLNTVVLKGAKMSSQVDLL